MAKPHLRLVSPRSVNGTVPPRRVPNEAEVSAQDTLLPVPTLRKQRPPTDYVR